MVLLRQINEDLRLSLLDLKEFARNQPELKQRDLEKKGTHFLLHQLFEEPVPELFYNENGKPHLKGRQGFISISHSHDKLALLYNRKESTGVDIELIRDKVIAIQHKFLNDKELIMANGDVETLLYFWAVKETLYKIHGRKSVDFKKHLFVDEVKDHTIYASIRMEKTEQFLLRKEKVDNYILVYAEKKI